MNNRSGAGLLSSEPTQLLEALSGHLSPEQIEAVLQQTGRHSQRNRRLPAPAVVWLCIAIGLWGDRNLADLWRQIYGTLASHLLANDDRKPPVKSAISQARDRLGARPLRQLLLRTGTPLAANAPGGAFYKGMRLMAIDGDSHQVPDTPANDKAFGRPTTRRNGQVLYGGYPRVEVIRLMEIGTRITCDALVRPYAASEYRVGGHLLAKASAGSLVLWDKVYFGYTHLRQALETGRHVLGRVSANPTLAPIRHLSDGSYLARMQPPCGEDGEPIVVRVLEYTFDDPQRPGHGERQRLVTTLLDETQYPALELIALYHERWEIEIANDEITTHQLARPVELRSRTPRGVVQEVYAVLLAHNAVRALMHEAAVGLEVQPRQLSFVHALRVIREAAATMRNAPTPLLPVIYRGMLKQIGQGRLPERDNRINPRVVKVRATAFATKKPEHRNIRHPTKPFIESVVMLK